MIRRCCSSRWDRHHAPALVNNEAPLHWLSQYCCKEYLMFSKTCLVVVLTFASSACVPGAATCDAQAAEKKASGAAQTSFLKKCKEDAAAQCEVQAKEKNLAG